MCKKFEPAYHAVHFLVFQLDHAAPAPFFFHADDEPCVAEPAPAACLHPFRYTAWVDDAQCQSRGQNNGGQAGEQTGEQSFTKMVVDATMTDDGSGDPPMIAKGHVVCHAGARTQD